MKTKSNWQWSRLLREFRAGLKMYHSTEILKNIDLDEFYQLHPISFATIPSTREEEGNWL